MKKRIIVTGANGFIGSHIIAELIASEVPVSAIVRNSSNCEILKKIKCHNVIKSDKYLDPALLRKISISKPEYLIHCAYDKKDSVNANNLIESVQLAKQLNCKSFITLGTYHEYGKLFNNIDESTVCEPQSEFGKSKFALYLLANRLCNELEINHCHVRLSIPYSVRENDNFYFTKVIKALSKGEKPNIETYLDSFDYVHVSDLSRGILSLINNNASGVFNLGLGEAVQNKIILNMIYEEFKKKLIVKDQDIINRLDNTSFYLNTQKIYKFTNWKPTISIWDGVSMLVNENKFNSKANLSEFTNRIRSLCK